MGTGVMALSAATLLATPQLALDLRPLVERYTTPPDMLQRLKAGLGSRYAIERELGVGGMATVYLAHDVKHDRKVAIKVLRPELSAVLGADRFVREIKTTANLQHPNILPLFDSGEVGSFLYYVMPYVEGETLRQKLTRERQLGVEEAVAITKAIATALDYAHERGVIHRDIKPENVLMHRGQPILADFGIALAVSEAGGTRITETGLSVGTPHYMAPELSAGDRQLDARADVYSLGALLYEMLVGDPPFAGSNPQAVLARIMTEPPPPLRAVRPGVGQEIEAALSRALAKSAADRFQTASAFAQALMQSAPASSWSSSRRKLVVTVGAIAVVLLGVVAAIIIRVPSERTPTNTAIVQSSIAVLPFRDMSPERDQEWFGEGIAEEILSALSRLEGLRVVARTSSFSLRDAPIAEIRRTLGVGSVLEGSVRRDAESARIEARLVNAVDDATLWSQSFHIGLTDVFKTQDSIARAVVSALRVELSERGSAITVAGTAIPAAQEQYLRGRYSLNQRTEAGLLAAIDHFRQAVELDSNYVAAWAGLADSYLVIREYSSRLPPDDVGAEAEAASARALALDPNGPEALTSAAWSSLIHRYDWEEAETLLRRALALDSTHVDALHWLSHVLSWQGRHDEALELARRATEADPLSPLMQSNLGYILMDAGRYEDAANYALSSLDRYPAFFTTRNTVWESYTRARQWSQAADAWLRWTEATNRDSEAAQLVAHMLRERQTGASFELDSVLVDRLQLGSNHTGVVYAAVGDTAGALAALERAFEDRDGSRSLLSMKVNPVYDDLRADPRFVALMERVGLTGP